MTILARGVILYRTDGKKAQVLLLRNRRTGNWGFPKGRRDAQDRHEIDTALREVAEETGFRTLDLHPTFRVETDYVVRDEPGGDYGKRVVYFLSRAPAETPKLSEEHDRHVWADRSQAAELLSFGQLRDLAQAAFDAIESR